MISLIKKQTADFMEELSHVDWPSQSKVRSASWTVISISVFVGLFLWSIDWIFSRSFGYFLPKS
ncbi:MAG: preprotein translocase subunit SecE [Holophagaceae bacterium]|nr:preprotein translocase subunit SecE [Acidobacteriota bacterium]